MPESAKKILLVDDEPEILKDLAPVLKGEGYCVRVTNTGEKALELAESFEPDLVILDVMLPKMDGHEVLRCLQKRVHPPKVILLTIRSELFEEAAAFQEGATDYLLKPHYYLLKPHYLSKPFSHKALLARVKKALLPVAPPPPPTKRLVSGDLVVELDAQRVWLAEQELDLTRRGYALLVYLMRHAAEERVLTHERLVDQVWGWQDVSSGGHIAIRTRIRELRRLLKDDANRPHYIQTVHGQGYQFIASVVFQV